ncbi:MAG: ATP-dependent protease LonB [Candidatus Micrarchaeia archaeon]
MAKTKPAKIKTTADVPVPEKLIDWIIGQDKAVEIVKKAAKQRRNVLLMGEPGTGKSMLAQSMAELMPVENLEDVLIYPNPIDENRPLVRVVKTWPTPDDLKKYGEERKKFQAAFMEMNIKKPNEQKKFDESIGFGRRLYEEEKAGLTFRGSSPILLPFALIAIAIILALFYVLNSGNMGDIKWIVMATIIGLFFIAGMMIFGSQLMRRPLNVEYLAPKLLIDNSGKKTAPFIDATGAKAGALFGDVKHDPLQSGGLGTPAHLRVEAGAIHRANKGVLFIDEVSSLSAKSQQELLTAMQEKKYPITGQSELSSGALVMTEPIPCDFVLVAAGNLLDIQNMHPALRSRIRGYGYEVYLEETMPDTPQNRKKLVQFVAQEVKKDGKIPHFTMDAVEEIIKEARRKAGRKNRLTLKLRELGGLVRAAGDIAKEENAEYVDRNHVKKAKEIARTLEQQITAQFIDVKKDYKVFVTSGYAIGKVNGLAVIGDASSGIVLPIVAEVAPALSKSEGKLIATGKLGEIAKEAVENVSAIIKKHMGKDVSQYDIHIQFLQTYEGVEGDSASISIAVSVISAMEEVEVDQNIAMTGSLSVRGEVLPVGGITAKVEAALEAGIGKVILPAANIEDVCIDESARKKIQLIPVSNIVEVLEHALKDCPKKRDILERMRGVIRVPVSQSDE